MRTIPGTLAAPVAASSATWGEVLVLAARDGARAGFTSLDRAQAIDLGFGAGSETCDGGMTVSAVTLSAGLDASFAEVTGPLGPVLTRAGVEGGRWTDAQAWLVRVSPSAAGFIAVLRGKVREARVEGQKWVIEIRNQADGLNQERGREISAYCDAEFTDDRCKFVEPWIAATVTAVTDALRFTIDAGAAFADDWFNLGRVRFLDGELTGVESDLIFDWAAGVGDTGTVTLFTLLPSNPMVGGTLEIRRGCARTRAACLEYDNVINFRGYPDAPGSDQILRPQIPSS